MEPPAELKEGVLETCTPLLQANCEAFAKEPLRVW